MLLEGCDQIKDRSCTRGKVTYISGTDLHCGKHTCGLSVCVCALEMGQKAAELALKDAGVEYSKVQAVAASYCYGDPTSGKQICTV